MSFLNVTLRGMPETLTALKMYGANVMAALLTKTQALTLDLQRHVVEDKLSGQVLNVRSGDLRRSIQQDVTQTGDLIVGRVFSSGDVKYAAIHEFGGDIHMPPRAWDVKLRTTAAGELMRQKENSNLAVFARTQGSRAHADSRTTSRHAEHQGYTIHMPERSYMRSSLADMAEGIMADLKSTALSVALTR